MAAKDTQDTIIGPDNFCCVFYLYNFTWAGGDGEENPTEADDAAVPPGADGL